jgi:hypothetical protein
MKTATKFYVHECVAGAQALLDDGPKTTAEWAAVVAKLMAAANAAEEMRHLANCAEAAAWLKASPRPRAAKKAKRGT